MKVLSILLALFSCNCLGSSSKFECKFVDYYLTLEARGSEHINHELKINGKIPVIELGKQNWFIEEVNCKRTGYEIIASHVQYNDTAKQTFMLTYRVNSGYSIHPL